MYFIFIRQYHILSYRKKTLAVNFGLPGSFLPQTKPRQTEGIKMNWIQKNRHEILHYNMALIGGISGAYAILVRGGNFGAAETTNLIELALDCAEHNVMDIVVRMLILLIYSSSIITAHLISLKIPDRKYPICLTFECICVLLAGLIPTTLNPLVALYPIFAMSAFQWQIFTDSTTYNSATIFSTNNLKQALLSWTNYRLERDFQQKKRAVFFTRTLLAFHIGVLLGWLSVRFFNEKGIWVTFALFGTAFYCSAPCREPKPSGLSRPEMPTAQE